MPLIDKKSLFFNHRTELASFTLRCVSFFCCWHEQLIERILFQNLVINHVKRQRRLVIRLNEELPLNWWEKEKKYFYICSKQMWPWDSRLRFLLISNVNQTWIRRTQLFALETKLNEIAKEMDTVQESTDKTNSDSVCSLIIEISFLLSMSFCWM